MCNFYDSNSIKSCMCPIASIATLLVYLYQTHWLSSFLQVGEGKAIHLLLSLILAHHFKYAYFINIPKNNFIHGLYGWMLFNYNCFGQRLNTISFEKITFLFLFIQFPMLWKTQNRFCCSCVIIDHFHLYNGLSTHCFSTVCLPTCLSNRWSGTLWEIND